MKKIILSAMLTSIFLVVLSCVYMLHVKYFRVNVVFYASIFDAFLAAVILGLLIWRIRYFTMFEKFQLIIIWILIGYSFAISVPTVIDRSLSFYILEKIEQRGGGIRLDAFEEVFTKEYVREHRLVDVRLTEQMESGTVEIKDGCVKLTPKGVLIAEFSRYFRKNWLPRKRLLMGRYSDDLTDPFRHSGVSVDYNCE